MLRLCLAKIFLLLMILAVPASMVENVGGKEGDCSMDPEQGSRKRGSCSDQGGWKCTHEECLAAMERSAWGKAQATGPSELKHKMLVVDILYGGLSNRREGMIFALMAARLLRRRLVISEYFDVPLADNFGPCFRCIRPLSHYFEISDAQREQQPGEAGGGGGGQQTDAGRELVSLEELYEHLDHAPPPSVQAVCRTDPCQSTPPDWIPANQTIVRLQGQFEAQNMTTFTPEQLVEQLGGADADIIWMDTGFRLLDYGERHFMDGWPETHAMLKRCSVCLGQCHQAETDDSEDRWCDPECRHACLNRVCGEACSVSEGHLGTFSRLPSVEPPKAMIAALASLSPSRGIVLDAVKASKSFRLQAQGMGIENVEAGGSVYACAHWRTGDWAIPLSVEVIAQGIATAVAPVSDSILGVFLSTDASTSLRRELEHVLNSTGKGMRLFDHPCAEGAQEESHCPGRNREEGWMEHEHDTVEAAMFDQQLCARASVFVGTRGSTFTQAIVWERVRAGWPLDTNYLIP